MLDLLYSVLRSRVACLWIGPRLLVALASRCGYIKFTLSHPYDRRNFHSLEKGTVLSPAQITLSVTPSYTINDARMHRLTDITEIACDLTWRRQIQMLPKLRASSLDILPQRSWRLCAGGAAGRNCLLRCGAILASSHSQLPLHSVDVLLFQPNRQQIDADPHLTSAWELWPPIATAGEAALLGCMHATASLSWSCMRRSRSRFPQHLLLCGELHAACKRNTRDRHARRGVSRVCWCAPACWQPGTLACMSAAAPACEDK